MLTIFRTYGAPVLLGVALFAYVLDLRSTNKDLQQDKAQLIERNLSLEVAAALDAQEVKRLTASGEVITEIGEAQKERESAELVRVQKSLTRLENAIETIKNNPPTDGTVGPAVSARLREQREDATTILNERIKSLGRTPTDLLSTEAGLAGKPSDATANAGDPGRDDGPYERATRPTAIRDSDLGP